MGDMQGDYVVAAGNQVDVGPLVLSAGRLKLASLIVQQSGNSPPCRAVLIYRDSNSNPHTLDNGTLHREPNESLSWTGDLPVSNKDQVTAKVLNPSASAITVRLFAKVESH